MSNYIERDYIESDEYDINKTSTSGNSEQSTEEREYLENLERWKWLTDKWPTMSFKEKMSLFIPYLHYVNLRNFTKSEIDDELNRTVVDKAYELCRPFRHLEFDPDHHGVPNLIMVFGAVNINAIPVAEIKSAVKLWGITYGFIKEEVTTSTKSCCDFYGEECCK